MNSQDYIDKILIAKHIKEIINDDSDIKKIWKMIHPDICKLPKAESAFIKFNELKNDYEIGYLSSAP